MTVNDVVWDLPWMATRVGGAVGARRNAKLFGEADMFSLQQWRTLR